jgi:hypothetical protein
MLEKYRLKDGSIYWHHLYFSIVPNWMIKYSPPGGSYNYAAYMYQPHKYFRDIYCNCKYFFQRGIKGYSERDAWGWYSHHAKMMVGVLQYLRKSKHGCPPDLTSAKWDKILLKMINGFQTVEDEQNDFISYKVLTTAQYRKFILNEHKKLTLALKYFQKYYFSLWD